MTNEKPAILVTGVSGNLGLRLLPLLSDYYVIGADLNPPETETPLHFVTMDLGEEGSCRDLMLLLRESQAVAVIHLAFILDPVRNGILDVDRMWRINVAGTARLMEAIGETNRQTPVVHKVVVPSSVTVYGPDLPEPVSEEAPLGAHTLPYAVHKMEVERIISRRAPSLRGCSMYSLRSHIFAGRSVDNYIMGAFRGTPNGHGERAAAMRQKGTRLPCMLPMGDRYIKNRMQFVHVDDMARLISYIVQRTEPEDQRLTVLNVAGRGSPISLARCFEIAHTRAWRLPGKAAFRSALNLVWNLGISATPPEAAPYIMGEYLMDTQRLREFLGADYEEVMRHTVEEAFQDSFPEAS